MRRVVELDPPADLHPSAENYAQGSKVGPNCRLASDRGEVRAGRCKWTEVQIRQCACVCDASDAGASDVPAQ